MHLHAITAAAVLAALPAAAQTPPPMPSPIVATTVPSSPANVVFLPSNTEIILSMNDELSTKGGRLEVGTPFYLSVVHDVKLGDFIVIPKGSRGVGEVTWKTGKGAFGKSGKMDVELRYIELGGNRVTITGKYRQEGEGNTVATVGTVVLAGVFAGFVTGKSARIPAGRELSARTTAPIPVQLPPGASAASIGAITATAAPPAAPAAPAAPAPAPAPDPAPAAAPRP